MTADEKLEMIGDVCRHPGAFHWSGRQMANVIQKIITDDQPISFRLSDIDRPIPYEIVHDAVYAELEPEE